MHQCQKWMCSLRLSAKACVSRLSTKAHGCLSTCCRAGGVPLTTPVIVTGFVLDPAKARPPTKVDASGMLMVSGCCFWAAAVC